MCILALVAASQATSLPFPLLCAFLKSAAWAIYDFYKDTNMKTYFLLYLWLFNGRTDTVLLKMDFQHQAQSSKVLQITVAAEQQRCRAKKDIDLQCVKASFTYTYAIRISLERISTCIGMFSF